MNTSKIKRASFPEILKRIGSSIILAGVVIVSGMGLNFIAITAGIYETYLRLDKQRKREDL